jgi:hypothetical protein
MAPPHFQTGAMVYLANRKPSRGMRGVVSSLWLSPNAGSEQSLETAFVHGFDSRPSGTAHLKSFPSENTKRGQYV